MEFMLAGVIAECFLAGGYISMYASCWDVCFTVALQVSCNTLTPECAPVADALTMVHQRKQLRPRDQEVAAQQTVLNITHMGKQRRWQLAAAVRPETLTQASAAV